MKTNYSAFTKKTNIFKTLSLVSHIFIKIHTMYVSCFSLNPKYYHEIYTSILLLVKQKLPYVECIRYTSISY